MAGSIIYATNAIESLNAKLRRAVRTRGHFPTDEAAIKLLYLVLRQVAQRWKMPPRRRGSSTDFSGIDVTEFRVLNFINHLSHRGAKSCAVALDRRALLRRAS